MALTSSIPVASSVVPQLEYVEISNPEREESTLSEVVLSSQCDSGNAHPSSCYLCGWSFSLDSFQKEVVNRGYATSVDTSL